MALNIASDPSCKDHNTASTDDSPQPSRHLRVLEFYSGIGGMHYALKLAANTIKFTFEVLAAFDINTVANDVYRHNFPEVQVIQRLIESIPQAKFEKYAADMWTMSPPCQPFTRAGKQMDVEDARTKSFLSILEMLSSMTVKPRYLLLENVKGFESSVARNTLVSTLESCGYTYQEYLLTPEQLGIPNSRMRYYLVAVHEGSLPIAPTKSVLEVFPGDSRCVRSNSAAASGSGSASLKSGANVVLREDGKAAAESLGRNQDVQRLPCIADFLDADVMASQDAAQPYELDAKTVCRLTRMLDIVTPESTSSNCFTKGYGSYAEGTGSILQPFSTPAASNTVFHDHEMWAGWGTERCQCTDCHCARATSAAGASSPAVHATAPVARTSHTGHGAVSPIGGSENADTTHQPKKQRRCVQPKVHAAGECPLRVFRLRYFTEREIGRLMGFPDEGFVFPPTTTLKQQRRVLGNSLNVKVVARLMEHLLSTRVDP